MIVGCVLLEFGWVGVLVLAGVLNTTVEEAGRY